MFRTGVSGGAQARLGWGFSFFSLSLFLLNFLLLGVRHGFWARRSQSPAARITKSKRSSSPLAKRQK